MLNQAGVRVNETDQQIKAPENRAENDPMRNRSCIHLLHIRCLEENAISSCKAIVIYLTPNSMHLMSSKHDGK